MFLQTRQDGEIALIDHGSAMPLHVAVASFLLLRRAAMLLREGSSGERQRREGKGQEKSTHRVPSFREAAPDRGSAS
jgi:hypothetical protein